MEIEIFIDLDSVSTIYIFCRFLIKLSLLLAVTYQADTVGCVGEVYPSGQINYKLLFVPEDPDSALFSAGQQDDNY